MARIELRRVISENQLSQIIIMTPKRGEVRIVAQFLRIRIGHD